MINACSALNHHELREMARRFLPHGVFEYIDRGSEDEHALRELAQAWRHWQLTPQVMVDVTQRDCRTEIFGRTQSSPVIIAPTAMAGLVRYNGEVLMAQAAAQAVGGATLVTAGQAQAAGQAAGKTILVLAGSAQSHTQAAGAVSSPSPSAAATGAAGARTPQPAA